MTHLGIPVPPGFTITTQVCIEYQNGRKFPEGLEASVREAIHTVGTKMGKKFGDAGQPPAGGRSARAPRSPCPA